MIVHPQDRGSGDGELRATTQPDHAAFAAELLALWRRDGLPDHPRRADLLFAAREHDNGWRGPDAAPRVNPETRRPHTFLTIPFALRAEIWLRGIDRFSAERPYAALLIAEHAARLHAGHRDDEDRPDGESWTEFFAELDRRREGLLEAAEASVAEVGRDYRFIEWTDLMSLAVCSGWPGPFERHGLRFATTSSAPDTSVLGISPFPLAGATTFVVRDRTIPDRRYGSDSDLAVELATARWQERRVRVQALE